MANITEAEIRKIVENIIKGASSSKAEWTSTEYCGRKLVGVYSDMNEAIDAAERHNHLPLNTLPKPPAPLLRQEHTATNYGSAT